MFKDFVAVVGLGACAIMLACTSDPAPPGPDKDTSVSDVSDAGTDLGEVNDTAQVSDTGPISDSAGPDVPDMGPQLPFTVSDETEPVWHETLDPTPATWLALSWDDASVLAGDSEGCWRVDSEGLTILSTDDLFGPETLTAAVGLPNGEFLVAAAGGLYMSTGDTFASSPLSEYFTETTVIGLAAHVSGGILTLWISTGEGLHVWSEDYLHTLSPDGLASTDAVIAVAGSGDLWVGAAADIYRLTPTDDGYEAWAEHDALSSQAVAVDAAGYVWITAESVVHLRTPGPIWFDLAELLLSGVYANPSSAHVWFDGADARWHLHGDTLRPTDGPTDAGAGLVDGLGRLVLATAGGILRVHPGRGVQLEGFPESGVMASSVSLTVAPDSPELVSALSVTVAGQEVEVSEAWQFTIDPHSLGEGDYQVVVEVTYTDVTVPTSAGFAFTVVLPTWTDDIQPLADLRCGACHGAQGSLNVKLFTKAQWEENFALILYKVAGTDTVPPTMPPGDTLDDDHIVLIALWQEAGFL